MKTTCLFIQAFGKLLLFEHMLPRSFKTDEVLKLMKVFHNVINYIYLFYSYICCERDKYFESNKGYGKFTDEAGEQTDMLEGRATFQMYFYRLKKLADRNHVKFKGTCEV